MTPAEAIDHLRLEIEDSERVARAALLITNHAERRRAVSLRPRGRALDQVARREPRPLDRVGRESCDYGRLRW